MGVINDDSYAIVDGKVVAIHAKVKPDTDLVSMGSETVCALRVEGKTIDSRCAEKLLLEDPI
jgi:hypothetical protein